MNKRDFFERLCRAGKAARDFATNYVKYELPGELCFTIRSGGLRRGTQGPPGTIKFIGGRFLRPDELKKLDARRAASLLWVDGKVPAWINIGVNSYSETHTELMILFNSELLVPANENELPPDVGCQRGNSIVPFRIRGPDVLRDWSPVPS